MSQSYQLQSEVDQELLCTAKVKKDRGNKEK